MRARSDIFDGLKKTYFISCSRVRNSSVSKKSTSVMPKPSQSIFMVTLPGFWLFP